MTSIFRRLSFLCLITLSLIDASGAMGQGALMVNPKRIILDGSKRTDMLTLFNAADDTTTYAISFLHYQMLPDGTFRPADSNASTAEFADSLLRYFPLEVTLAPHASQSVRIRFMKPKNLAPGEYRTHLYFRSLERTDAIENHHNDSAKTVTVELKPVFGLAVPIIVRNETTPSIVTISNVQVSPKDTAGKVKLSMDIGRKGNESAYGALVATYQDKSGKETELGITKGVAIYYPLTTIHFTMQIEAPAAIDLKSGSIRIDFQTLTGAKETKLATTQISMN